MFHFKAKRFAFFFIFLIITSSVFCGKNYKKDNGKSYTNENSQTPDNSTVEKIPADPKKTEAVLKALKLYFERVDNTLFLMNGLSKAPLNISCTLYGIRERGSGDQWEAFSCFDCKSGTPTLHKSYYYAILTDLPAKAKCRFKFKLVPKETPPKKIKNIVPYYGETIETEWMELQIPKLDKTPKALSSMSTFKKIMFSETKRDDKFFNENKDSFEIVTDFREEYWIGKGGFFDNFICTSPFKHNLKNPYAFTLCIVELKSTDDTGKERIVYNIEPYYFGQNTFFPVYGGDLLFPESGTYKWQGKIYFFSMSGKNMIHEKVAIASNDSILAGIGVYNSDKAPELLKSLQEKYPFHTIDLPETQAVAIKQ